MIKTSKMKWDGSVDISADEALAAANASRGGQIAKKDPLAFLMDVLANGPVPKTTIDERAKVHGLTEHKLRAAREKAGIVVFRTGGTNGFWAWSLPQHAPADQ